MGDTDLKPALPNVFFGYFVFSSQGLETQWQLTLALFSRIAESTDSSSSETNQEVGGAQGNIWKKGVHFSSSV